MNVRVSLKSAGVLGESKKNRGLAAGESANPLTVIMNNIDETCSHMLMFMLLRSVST